MHSHPEPKTDAEISTWIKNMDEVVSLREVRNK